MTHITSKLSFSVLYHRVISQTLVSLRKSGLMHNSNQWRMQVGGGGLGMRTPSQSKFFHFQAVFGQNNRLVHTSLGLAPPCWKP